MNQFERSNYSTNDKSVVFSLRKLSKRLKMLTRTGDCRVYKLDPGNSTPIRYLELKAPVLDKRLNRHHTEYAIFCRGENGTYKFIDQFTVMNWERARVSGSDQTEALNRLFDKLLAMLQDPTIMTRDRSKVTSHLNRLYIGFDRVMYPVFASLARKYNRRAAMARHFLSNQYTS